MYNRRIRKDEYRTPSLTQVVLVPFTVARICVTAILHWAAGCTHVYLDLSRVHDGMGAVKQTRLGSSALLGVQHPCRGDQYPAL